MEITAAQNYIADKLSTFALDSFEVVGMSQTALVIEAKRQMMDSCKKSETRGLAIRVIEGGRLGFASTTDITKATLDAVVSCIMSSLSSVMVEPGITIPKQGTFTKSFIEKLGRTFDEIPLAEKIAMALTLESDAIATDSRITHVQFPEYAEEHISLSVLNSNGINLQSHRELARICVKAIASDHGASEAAYEYFVSPRFEDLYPSVVASEAAKEAIAKLGGKPCPSGAFPVIFAPRAACVMVKIAAPSFFADNVYLGKSVLAGKQGERLYQSDISIIDDGLLPDGVGSFLFDGEGVPRRRTVMVGNGVVKNWLYDASSACRDKVSSTGNCRRSNLRTLPKIDVGNCYVDAGKRKNSELISTVSRGLYIKDLIGVHTANTVTGDFSLGVEGALIENGVVTSSVRGVTIAGNVHQVFKNVSGVGDDLKFYDTYGAPSVLVEGLMISG